MEKISVYQAGYRAALNLVVKKAEFPDLLAILRENAKKSGIKNIVNDALSNMPKSLSPEELKNFLSNLQYQTGRLEQAGWGDRLRRLLQ